MWMLVGMFACSSGPSPARTDDPSNSTATSAPLGTSETGDTANAGSDTAAPTQIGEAVVAFPGTRGGVPGLFLADAQGASWRIADGEMWAVTPSPDGQALAVSSSSGLQVYDLDGVLLGEVDGAVPLEWSDDSAWLAMEGEDAFRRAGVLERSSGTWRWLVDGDRLYGVAWQPGGHLLAIVHEVSVPRLEVFDADGSAMVAASEPSSSVSAPHSGQWSWSPDGEWLAYIERPVVSEQLEFASVVRADGTDRRALRSTEAGDLAMEPRWSPDSAHVAWIADLNHSPRTELFVSAPDIVGVTKVSLPSPAGNGNVFDLAWSAHGDLAYVGQQSVEGRTDVYVTDATGANVRWVEAQLRGALMPDALHWVDRALVFEDYESSPARRTLFRTDDVGTPAVQLSLDGYATSVVPHGDRIAWLDGGGLQLWDGVTTRALTTDLLTTGTRRVPFAWLPDGSGVVALRTVDGQLLLLGADGAVTELTTGFDEVGVDFAVVP